MSMLSIGDVLVDPSVLEAYFSCNLAHCRGGCCVEGELGAPLEVREADELENPPGELLRMLADRARRHIARHGSVESYQGALYSRTIEGRECVFAVERDGITLCAIELAFRDGIIAFDKPLSCRLFPIRVRKKFGLPYLVYEQIPLCLPARQQGGELRVRLVDYLKAPLEELYGPEWTESLRSFDHPSERP